MATTTPAPIPVPTPVATTPPATSTAEFWINKLGLLLTAFYLSGVIPTTSETGKIVGAILAALSSLGFTASRTLIKTSAIRAAKLGIVLLIVGGFAMTSTSLVGCTAGCATTSGATAGSGSGSGSAQGFAGCSLADLEKDVGGNSLLGTVATDLLSSNYAKLIADLIAQVGADEVRCAVLALDDLEIATGSGATALAPFDASSRLARGKAIETTYGWTRK